MINTRFLFEYEDYYLSHRAKAFNGRLNTMIGYRHVEDTNLHQGDGTWSYGAIFEVTKGLSVFGSISNTFVFSNAYNIQGSGVTAADNARVLDPETGKSWEAGLKTDLRDSELTGTVSIFQIQRTGVVTADFDANATDPRNNDLNPNNDVRYQRNGGLQESEGADFDLIWTPNRNLQLVLDYVYTVGSQDHLRPSPVDMTKDTRIYQKTFLRRLAKSPEHQASLVAKYSFNNGKFKGLSLGSGIRYLQSDYQANASTSYDSGRSVGVDHRCLRHLFGAQTAMGNPMDIRCQRFQRDQRDQRYHPGPTAARFGASVRFRFSNFSRYFSGSFHPPAQAGGVFFKQSLPVLEFRWPERVYM